MVALALGLDLYLSLLALAVLGYLPIGLTEPGQLEHLASPWILLAAAALYGLSWFPERHRATVLAWEAFHLPARMVAAGLLALLLLSHPGMPEVRPHVLAAAGIAGGVQLLRVGWGIILTRGMGRALRPRGRRLAEGGTGLGLLWLALVHSPLFGLAAAGVILVLLVATSVPPLRAARFTLHLLRGQLGNLVGATAWRFHERLPRWIRRRVESRAGAAVRGTRGVPAGLVGVPDAGLFRAGWFVLGPEGPVFMYRTPRQVWEVELFRGRPTLIRAHPELLRVDWRDQDGRFALFLPRSIPEEEFRELTRTTAPA